MRILLPIVFIFILCSCSPDPIDKKVYMDRLLPEMQKHGNCYWGETEVAFDETLELIKDTSTRMMWRDIMLTEQESNKELIDAIEQISYIVMYKADNLPKEYTQHLDTANPIFMTNFNESKKTLSLLKNGLNKEIRNYAANFDTLFLSPLTIEDSKLPPLTNEISLVELWDELYSGIKTAGDFQVAKYKLYYMADLVILNRFKYYQRHWQEENAETEKKYACELEAERSKIEEPPQFEAGLQKYFEKGLRGKLKGFKEKTVRIVIAADGTACCKEITLKNGKTVEDAVLKDLVNSMPKWKPGKDNGDVINHWALIRLRVQDNKLKVDYLNNKPAQK